MKLLRIHQDDDATRGLLINDDGTEICKTLELPWRDNHPDVSCIPTGIYHAERYLSPRHGFVVFRLTDVPGREMIEIHPANLTSQLLGCIAVGFSWGDVHLQTGESGHGILSSQAAFHTLMTAHPEQQCTLHVTALPSPQ